MNQPLWPNPSQIIGKPGATTAPPVVKPTTIKGESLWPDAASILGPSAKNGAAAPVGLPVPTKTPTAVLPPSKSPFNPNTPGNEEFNKQLEQRAGSQSLFKNFFSALADPQTYLSPQNQQRSSVESTLLPKPAQGMTFKVGDGIPTKKDMAAKTTELDNLKTEIEKSKPNTKSQLSVDLYNAKIDNFNAKLTDYQQILTKYFPTPKAPPTFTPPTPDESLGTFPQKDVANPVTNNPIDITGGVNGLAHMTQRAVAEVAQSLVPVKYQNPIEPVTQTPLFRFLVGDETLKPLAQQTVEQEQKFKDAGFGKASTPLALLSVSTNTALALLPLTAGLGKAANEAIAQIAKDASTKELTITFKDAQAITQSTSEAEAVAKIGQAKYDAFKATVSQHPDLLRAFSGKGLTVLKTEETPLSSTLKKASGGVPQEGVSYSLPNQPKITPPPTLQLPGKQVVPEIPKVNTAAPEPAKVDILRGKIEEAVKSNDTAFLEKLRQMTNDSNDEQLKATVKEALIKATANLKVAPTNQAEDETKFANDYVDKNLEKAKMDYNNHVINHYGADNVISTDDAKAVIPKYNGSNSDEYQKAAGELTKKIYQDRLVSQQGKGNNEVLFTAGGTGAGKTTTLKGAGVDLNKYSIVYDTNMNDIASATQKIQAALDHGFQVDIKYIFRHPADAYEHGVIPRIGREGRVVTVNGHVGTHYGSYVAIPQLMEKFKDNPNVRFKIYNNSELNTVAKQVSFDELPKVDYNNIKGQLHEKLTAAKQAGAITAEQHARASMVGRQLDVAKHGQEHKTGPSRRQEVSGSKETKTKVKDRVIPDNIKNMSTKELVDGLRNNGGHPGGDEKSLRYEYLRTLQDRGWKKVLEDLHYSTDLKSVWYNENTGTEYTLGELLGLTEQTHGAFGLPKDANEQIPFILENWHPLEGKNPIVSKVAALSDKDVFKIIVDHFKSRIERAGDLATFKTDANNGGGSLSDIGSLSGGKDKIKVALHDGRELTFPISKIYEAGKQGTNAVIKNGLDALDIITGRKKPPTFAKEQIKTVIKPDWAKSDDLTPGIIEQLKNAEPGKRMAGGDSFGQGSTVDTIAWKSTFPDWIPEDLRKSSIIKPVAEHLAKGTLPTAQKQIQLYNYIAEMIDAEALAKEDGIAEANKEAQGKSLEEINQLISETQNEQTTIQKPSEAESQIKEAKGNQNRETKIPVVSNSYGFNPKNLEDLEKPAATKETDKIVKRSDIAKQLSEKLGVPLRRGKFNTRGAIGIFKPDPKVIRLKKGGLATVFHEIGHFIDDKFNYDFSKALDIKEAQALMEEYGNKYENQPDKQRKEGFAEFIRFSMTGQEAKAAELAPKFAKTFEAKLKELPEIKDVLDVAKQDYARWQSQPAVAKVLSHISLSGDIKGGLGDRLTNNLHNLYTMALDDLHPLAEFSALAKKQGVNLPSETDPYVLARNLRGWIGKANTFLTKGTFGKNYWALKDGKTVANYSGESFTDIMKPIEKAGKLDDFRVYLVAQRAVELASREKPIAVGISKADAEAALEELNQKNPDFSEKAQALYKYQDDLLQYAHENGLIGINGMKAIKKLNQYRVPFYRVMEFERSGFMGGKKIAGNLGSPIKKIKGSEREIIDPIESIIKDTYAIINAAERNNIGVAMANLSKTNFELGRLFEQTDKPMKPVSVSVKEVMEAMTKNLGIEMPETVQEEIGDMAVTLFRPTIDAGPNMLNVNMGDKKLVFQVDPDLFNAIQGLNAEDVGIIMRVLSMPAKLLRAGATLSPDFAVRNPLRDQFSAMVYSKFGYRPGYDLIKGVFELFKAGDVYNLWKMGGGEHSMMVSLDREYLQSNFKELVRSKGGTLFHYVKHPIDALRLVSEIGEQATRLGEMKRALDAGANPIESAFASREITLDFARIGAKTKGYNAIVAFANANMQGLDKMVREFKNDPFRKSWKVVAGITLPSIALYFANRHDKRWKEIPQWQKDLFWIVMTKDHIYRIPKPFELGILFGSVPERILEFIDTHDKNLFPELESSVANGATPGFIPTSLIPIIENITNYSFFLDRPIVPQGKEALPPEAQSGTYTSEIAKLIGEKLGYSPSKIDNLIQGYSGGLGKYATSGVDKILTGTGISTPPPAPAAQFEDTAVLKAFLIRNPVGTASESVNRVYNEATQAAGDVAYIKKLVEDGEPEKAKAFIKDHPEIVYYKALTSAVASFTTINAARDKLRQSRVISPKAKQEKIAELDKLETQIAEDILKQINH